NRHMCGIAGIAGPAADSTAVKRMTDAMVHRGPDAEGLFKDREACLGIRRLKIIDLVTGDQPIANEDQSVWVVLNGEIYNFRELRDELRSRGHVFCSQSDTECIVHAYEEYGDGCVSRLRGMFAFALWDVKRQRLLLARDRVGKKPLVYAELNGSLYFASEFQSLFGSGALDRQIDFGALGDYLAYGYVPVPSSIYGGIRKLPPGHYLTWNAGSTSVTRYWQLSFKPKLRISEREALAELERELREAVKLRLVADVPLGALLSGGVDSSTVVALMAQLTPGRVKTFSIGFEEADFNELQHARRVAERYDTDHHELIVRPDAAAVLPTLVRHYGEPYADSSAIPTFYVSKLARQHVTVALNGDGGDEAFAGYDRHRAMQIAAWIAHVPGASSASMAIGPPMAGNLRLPSRVRRAGRFLEAVGRPPADRLAQWVATLSPSRVAQLLKPDILAQARAQRSKVVEREFERNAGLDLTDQVLATEVNTYLLNDLLVKMDIASMANSLETRSPLLDHRVLEFAASLPAV